MWTAKEMQGFFIKRAISKPRNLSNLEKNWNKATDIGLVDPALTETYLEQKKILEAKAVERGDSPSEDTRVAAAA